MGSGRTSRQGHEFWAVILISPSDRRARDMMTDEQPSSKLTFLASESTSVSIKMSVLCNMDILTLAAWGGD